MFGFETRKIHKVLFICLLAILLIFFAVMVVFYSINKSKAYQEAEMNLQNVSEISASAIQTKLTQPLHYMNSIINSYTDKTNPKKLVEHMLRNDTNDIFQCFTWIEKDGKAYTSKDTKNSYSIITLTPYMEDIFSGRSYISFTNYSEISRTEAILFGVPILTNGEVSSIVIGNTSPTKLGNYTLFDLFQGEGYAHLIDSRGNVVAKSQSSKISPTLNNFFKHLKIGAKIFNGKKIQEVISDFENNKSGFLYYKLEDNRDKMAYYQPLNIANWFLLSIVPTKNLNNNLLKQPLYFSLGFLGLLIITGIIIFVFYIFNKRYRENLEKTLYTDPITGGINSAKFEKLVRERLRDKNTDPHAYTFISLDLVGFKLINDINGGGGGDATLTYMYNKLKKYLEPNDLMCRVDADIFNMLIKTKHIEVMENLLSKFTEDLNRFNENRKDKYYLRVKAGLYTIPNGWISFTTIRDRSNIARKIAKKKTSTDLFVYDIFNDAELHRQTKEREYENAMKQALENQEFKMFLQPKINIQTGKIAGAEALVRWISPTYGMIQPDAFIPMFERNGFITQIDLNQFKQACIFLRELMDKGKEPIHISVNLSRAHLFNPNFLEDFIAIREEYNIPAAYLEFEITESMAFEQLESMSILINKIHEAGFTCSIDDFGSGYSSLNALGDIPADVLKLDRAFFKIDPYKKVRNKRIIASIIALAKQLDMKVVAEGIETTSQAHFLHDVQCDIIQGFIYSRPLPLNEFKKFIETWNEQNITFDSYDSIFD